MRERVTTPLSETSHRKSLYLENTSTIRRYIICFQQGPCRNFVTSENLEITLELHQIQTPNFHSNSHSSQCKGHMQHILPGMQGQVTLSYALLRNLPLAIPKLKSGVAKSY